MRFGILGPTDVRLSDGRLVAVGGARLRALLAMLLLETGRVVAVERLIDGLYGAEPPDGVTNALQVQVFRLRQALRAEDRHGALVESHPAGYRLAVQPDEVDAHRFQRLATDGQRALTADDHPAAAGLLREALALWRGPALADVGDAPFVQAQVARLEESRLAAVEDRVEADLALGGYRGLVAELQGLVAAHPLRERLTGQLMRALSGSGRQAEALAVYEDARRTLAEAFGADPSAELAAVHLAVLRGASAPRNTPAQVRMGREQPSRAGANAAKTPGLTSTPSAAALPRTLPAQLTSFVGRADELERIDSLLRNSRLVTLSGPGGAGKTRLAVEAAGRQAGDVCFVDLAPLEDRADVLLQAVLGALGLRETGLLPLRSEDPPLPDAMGRLVTALADRRILLVLDNCEHVIDAAAQLAGRLLSVCPEVRILATSREPLGITGEALCPVAPLALPPEGAAVRDALAAPAVRLFIDRASAGRPEFAVTPANVHAVVRICRALDGLPLAIELAAARVRSLPVTEVAARLDDRFRLLSRGSRIAQPRHQTLRAMVAWSWDLLDDAERVLARRLTVFAAGATLQAATRVCGRRPVNDEGGSTVIGDLLARLVDKSLVEVAGDGEPRYRMLDTVREYCAERLARAGEEEQLRRAHAEHFLALAETADPHLRRAEQLEWLARLAAEHDDLHAALRWAVAADHRLALRLLGALSSYGWLRGLHGESVPVAGALLRAVGPEPPEGLEEEYVLCVLNALPGLPRQEQRAHLERAETLMDVLVPPPRCPILSLLWGASIGPSARHAITPPPLYRHNQTSPDPWIRAHTQLGRAFVHQFTGGEAAAAEHAFTLALEGFRSVGERWGMAMALVELAEHAGRRGDRERSAALTDEALELTGQLGAMEDVAVLLCRRADGRIHGDDLTGARADYERAAQLIGGAGVPEVLAQAHHGLGEVARLRGDLTQARRLQEMALSGCPAGWFTAELLRSRIRIALGRIAEAEGDLRAASTWHREALTAVPGGGRSLPVAASAAEALAGVALAEGDGKRAALLLGAAVALRGSAADGDPDVARVSAATRTRIGDTAYRRAWRQGASMCHDQAFALLDAPPAPGG